MESQSHATCVLVVNFVFLKNSHWVWRMGSPPHSFRVFSVLLASILLGTDFNSLQGRCSSIENNWAWYCICCIYAQYMVHRVHSIRCSSLVGRFRFLENCMLITVLANPLPSCFFFRSRRRPEIRWLLPPQLTDGHTPPPRPDCGMRSALTLTNIFPPRKEVGGNIRVRQRGKKNKYASFFWTPPLVNRGAVTLRQ